MFSFSEILKDLILENGKSLRNIGLESGIPHSQLSRYIRNTIPKVEVSIKLAKYFNCTLDYLFGLTDERKRFENKYDFSKFISRYQKLLEENNTTHWKFSHQVNISESSIRQWKKGQIPKMETIIIIAENLSTSIDYLLGK